MTAESETRSLCGNVSWIIAYDRDGGLGSEVYCLTPMRGCSDTKRFCLMFGGFRVPIFSMFSEGEIVNGVRKESLSNQRKYVYERGDIRGFFYGILHNL